MRQFSLRGATGGGRRAVTLLCVLLVCGIETVFTAALPLYGSVLEYANPALIGLALSLSGGVAFLLLPLFVSGIDHGRLRSLMLACGIAMIVAVLLVGQARTLGPVALLAGSLAFGFGRTVGMVGILAMIAWLPGSRTVNQGWNGGLQRLGSLVALLLSGVFFAAGNWNAVFIVLAAMVIFWWFFVDRSAKLAASARESIVAEALPRSSPRTLEIVAACVSSLRSRRVLAAAALNILTVLAFTQGNSFFAIAFAPELGTVAATSLVVTTVVLRDGVAVTTGLLFPLILHRIGSRGMLWCLAVLAVLPFPLFVCIPEAAVGGAYLAAVSHGTMVGWGSATANLLATGVDKQGAGLRIAASQFPLGIVMLISPFAFGGVVMGLGPQAAYGMLLVVAAASAWVMVRASRGIDLAR